MPKKPRKKKKREKIHYSIEVVDWEVDFRFDLNDASQDLVPGIFWEHSNLILTGKILSPDIKNASSARIELIENVQLQDYWKPDSIIKSAKAVGVAEIPRGDDTLVFTCWVPPRIFKNAGIALSTGKLKYAYLHGEKLKWRRGKFST